MTVSIKFMVTTILLFISDLKIKIQSCRAIGSFDADDINSRTKRSNNSYKDAQGSNVFRLTMSISADKRIFSLHDINIIKAEQYTIGFLKHSVFLHSLYPYLELQNPSFH